MLLGRHQRLLLHRYLIDGTTGETLYMENHESVMDDDLDGMRLYRAIKAGKPITIQDEYLYELNKKKGGQDEKGTKLLLGSLENPCTRTLYGKDRQLQRHCH